MSGRHSRAAAWFLIAAAGALAPACGGDSGVTPGADAGAEAGADSGASDDEWAKCKWNGTASMRTPDVTLTGNNSADLTGAALGSATPDFAAQRKKVTVNVDSLAPELTVGDGYLWRNTPTSESAYLVITVANATDHVVCSIIGSHYRWLDDSGAAVMMGDLIYVNGSVALRLSGEFSDSCLGPGEKGTFTDVKVPNDSTALFSKTATVAFTLAGPFNPGTPPPGALVPQSYDVGTCMGGMPAVKVSLLNTGTGDVALEKFSLSPAVLIDDAGLPAGWLYLQVGTKATVAAGASATVYSSLFMEPNVHRLQAFIDFTQP